LEANVDKRIPSVLLLDNGELECAREALDYFDAEVVYDRARIVRASIAKKHQLLITTAHHALRSENVFQYTPQDERPVWITFHNQDFLPFRERLRRIGVDYLVHTTIEPELFRLLLMRLLFQDDERRETGRLPVGARVNCQLGGREIATTLADISPGGCLLLSPEPMDENIRLTLDLPVTLGDAKVGNQIPGHVARVDSLDRAPRMSPLWKLAIEFDIDPDQPVPTLERIEKGQAIGARVTYFQDTRVASSDPAQSQEIDPAAGLADAEPEAALDAGTVPALKDDVQLESVAKDRRIDPRTDLSGKRIVLFDEEAGVFFGRDLTRQGIRVEYRPNISVGDTLTLAISGGSRTEPLLLRSVVARNDGVEGLVLRFFDLPPKDLDHLDRIVASLPVIDPLADDLLAPMSAAVVEETNPDRS
jgi:hypothetical protein